MMKNIGIETESLALLDQALGQLVAGFSGLPAAEKGIPPLEEVQRVLNDVALRMIDNFPYFHPLYAGQMLKPPHQVARLAYMLSLYINPNNHALDGGRASSAMEKEAVAEIAAMFGWDRFLGHLTGGGTMANLEALWIAGQIHPDRAVLASTQAHYTHERLSGVLRLPFRAVPSDRYGRMDLAVLEATLDREPVGTVVATIGTTATGAADPLPGLLKLRDRYGFRIHADTAYGGYFRLVDNLSPATREVFDHLGEVDSIVVDPHKHGLQPYGCGCVLFKDPAAGQYYKHDSPYTYFSSDELHLGEISLECSRPGASAVALWATQKLLPLARGGAFASQLASGRNAALQLFGLLEADDRFLTAFPPELDIVIWLPKAASASRASELSRQLFELAGKHNLHLALAELPGRFFDLESAGMARDRDTITCLRSVLMKPEHESWVRQIWKILCHCVEELD
ncbi:MAG: aminotransferase class I/II-fold pyridoxal phosphate-dependent enzyme [Bacteroidales bacterium]